MPFKVHDIDSWEGLLDYSNSKHPWVYRGQKNACWGLQTSFDRFCTSENVENGHRERFEEALIREFRRAYHHYDSRVPPTDATLEWLSLMQHHGAPTRLLDFTYSPYVGAYFAVEEADDSCAVWAVNRNWILKQGMRRLVDDGKDHETCRRFCRELFEEEREKDIRHLFFDPPNVAVVFHVNPFHLNQRLRTQRGVFLIPGDIRLSFQDNLTAMEGYDSSENVRKIRIAKQARRDILRGLYGANISRTSLFPGLDGFARSLWTHHPLLERRHGSEDAEL